MTLLVSKSTTPAMQNSISSSAPLFIVVVNLCDIEEDIKQMLVYWITFLANQCSAPLSPPSHMSSLWAAIRMWSSAGRRPKMTWSSCKQHMHMCQVVFTFPKFIPMDCRQSSSCGIAKLADSIKESCLELSKQLNEKH